MGVVKNLNHNRYMAKSPVHASQVLEAFQSAGDVLRLRDVVSRTGFNKGMCEKQSSGDGAHGRDVLPLPRRVRPRS